MISKQNLKDKLEKLELLIDKTQPDASDKEQLFQQHQIDNCDNIRYIDNLKNQVNLSLAEREHLIYIMRTSNKVWKMRNRMLDGDWNLEDIKLDEMEKELRTLLPDNKVGAIKYYRKVMIDEFGKQVSLRDSKARIDNLDREMTYEQGLIINH